MACKQKIIKCFNAKATSYEQSADIQPVIAQNLAGRLFDMQPKHILEIGCGTGVLSEHLISSFPQAQFLLTDIAPAMVELTQKRFAHYHNVQTQMMDGESPNVTQQFDLIISSMALHWFTNFKESFKQIIDKLVPGGKFIFAMLGNESLHEWRSVFQHFSHVPPTPVFPQAGPIKQSYPNLDYDVETLEQDYTSTYAFLKTLKSIGAHAAHARHTSLPPGKLRQFIQYLDKKSPSKVTISYEVIYGSYVKS